MLPEHVSSFCCRRRSPIRTTSRHGSAAPSRGTSAVILDPKRPVPLEHYLWASKNIHKIVDSDKNFLEKGWKDANAALQGKDKPKAIESAFRLARGGAQPARWSQARGGQPEGREPATRWAERGGGAPAARQRRPSSSQPCTGPRGPRRADKGGFASAAQDKNLWVHLVQFLKKSNPAAGQHLRLLQEALQEENADALSKLQDFCNAKEKSAIHMTIEKINRETEARGIGCCLRLFDCGSCYREASLSTTEAFAAIVKELVEILFAQTLVKVLFATETIRHGSQPPNQDRGFLGLPQARRTLVPKPAPRRVYADGRPSGPSRSRHCRVSVIIVPQGGDEAPPVTDLRQMMLGEPSKLRSQFRLTYNMILNLLPGRGIEDRGDDQAFLLRARHAAASPGSTKKAVKLSEADLAKVKRDTCQICDVHMDECRRRRRTSGSLRRSCIKRCWPFPSAGRCSPPVGSWFG